MKLIPGGGSCQYLLVLTILCYVSTAHATIDIINTTPASNGCNGSVEIIAEGSAGSFSLSIDGNNPIPDINGNYLFENLCSGNHTIVITNAYMCETTLEVEVIECPSITMNFDIIKNESSCRAEDGSILILPWLGGGLGGLPPYSYGWSNGSTSRDQTNLASGDYTVTVTDANECTGTKMYTIEQGSLPDNVLSISGTTVSDAGECNGSITITVNNIFLGPYTISLEYDEAIINTIELGIGSYTFNSLCAGDYTLLVENDEGCQMTLEEQIEEKSCESLMIDLEIIHTCEGMSVGEIVANVTGGTMPYNYSWNTGATSSSIKDLDAGIYSITITDKYDCETTQEVEVIVGKIKVTGIVTNASCSQNNGSIIVSPFGTFPTPPFSYFWEDGSTDEERINLGPGEYCVTLTDGKGCTGSNCFDIINDEIEVGLVSFSNTQFCSDVGGCNGSIEVEGLSGVAPYSYKWSGETSNSSKISNLCEGYYSVTVTDSESCTGVFTTSICCCNGDPQFNPIGNEYNCYKNGSGLITIDNIDFKPVTNGEAGYIHITVSGGAELPIIVTWTKDGSFFSNNEDIDNLLPGKYCVKATDGCEEANYCREIVDCSTYAILIEGTTTVACPDHENGNVGKVKLTTISGGQTPYTFQWSNGESVKNLEGMDSGQYTVTVTDWHGCTESATFTVYSAETERPACDILCGKEIVESFSPISFKNNPLDCEFVDLTCQDGLIIDTKRTGKKIDYDPTNCRLIFVNAFTLDECLDTPSADGINCTTCFIDFFPAPFNQEAVVACDVNVCFFPTLLPPHGLTIVNSIDEEYLSAVMVESPRDFTCTNRVTDACNGNQAIINIPNLDCNAGNEPFIDGDCFNVFEPDLTGENGFAGNPFNCPGFLFSKNVVPINLKSIDEKEILEHLTLEKRIRREKSTLDEWYAKFEKLKEDRIQIEDNSSCDETVLKYYSEIEGMVNMKIYDQEMVHMASFTVNSLKGMNSLVLNNFIQVKELNTQIVIEIDWQNAEKVVKEFTLVCSHNNTTVNLKSKLSTVDQYQVYPNPLTGKLNIDINIEDNEEIEISINNLLGQNVFSEFKSTSKGFNHFQIDLDHIPDGVYIISIETKDGLNYSQRIVKSS